MLLQVDSADAGFVQQQPDPCTTDLQLAAAPKQHQGGFCSYEGVLASAPALRGSPHNWVGCACLPASVLQLTAVPKLTPAERRWRKKMAAAGGQPAEGEQPPSDTIQQQQQQGGRAASGRPGSGRQHQQQQQQPSGGRRGGRVPSARQPLVGRGSGGRFGAGGLAPQQQSMGSAAGGRQAAGRQQQQLKGVFED